MKNQNRTGSNIKDKLKLSVKKTTLKIIPKDSRNPRFMVKNIGRKSAKWSSLNA